MLHEFVKSITQAVLPSLSNGAVVFTVQGGIFSASGDPPYTVEVDGAHLTGASTVLVRDAAGTTLTARLPTGSIIDLNGDLYAVASHRQQAKKVSIVLSSALTSDLADGDSVSTQETTINVASSCSLSLDAYPTDGTSTAVRFGFFVHRDDLLSVPDNGWHVKRTKDDGTADVGKVVDVRTADAIVNVWCGG